MKNSTKILILCGVTLFSILLIIATFFDLQISFLFADLSLGEATTSNIYAIIFEILGESVLYFFLIFAFSVIFWYFTYNIKNNWKYTCQAISCLAIFITYFYFINKTITYLNSYMTIHINDYFLIFTIFISLLLTFLSILSLKFLTEKQINKLLKFAVIIICVAAVSNLITQISKGYIFGRMRFKSMNLIEDFSYYTPWFFLNGTSLSESLGHLGLSADAFKSFPSGHSTAAAITFTLICLPMLFDKFKTKFWKVFCWTTPIASVLIVGLARIISGAHFLSDVLMAGLITFLVTLFFKHIFIDRQNKINLKNK